MNYRNDKFEVVEGFKMKLGMYANGAVRQFAMNFAKGRIGNPLLNGIDYLGDTLREEPSFAEAAFAVFLNNLEFDGDGNTLNYLYSEKRAAQYIRHYLDGNYEVEPPFEMWEMELNPVSKEAHNK